MEGTAGTKQRRERVNILRWRKKSGVKANGGYFSSATQVVIAEVAGREKNKDCRMVAEAAHTSAELEVAVVPLIESAFAIVGMVVDKAVLVVDLETSHRREMTGSG